MFELSARFGRAELNFRIIDLYCCSPVRTASGRFWFVIYKHFTPIGVRTLHPMVMRDTQSTLRKKMTRLPCGSTDAFASGGTNVVAEYSVTMHGLCSFSPPCS